MATSGPRVGVPTSTSSLSLYLRAPVTYLGLTTACLLPALGLNATLKLLTFRLLLSETVVVDGVLAGVVTLSHNLLSTLIIVVAIAFAQALVLSATLRLMHGGTPAIPEILGRARPALPRVLGVAVLMAAAICIGLAIFPPVGLGVAYLGTFLPMTAFLEQGSWRATIRRGLASLFRAPVEVFLIEAVVFVAMVAVMLVATAFQLTDAITGGFWRTEAIITPVVLALAPLFLIALTRIYLRVSG